jgi:hypothetical protein
MKIEYFTDPYATEIGTKSQKYSSTDASNLLSVFIKKLNNDTNDVFSVFNVVKMKRIKNKLYAKLFVQNVRKKYVRLYFVEAKLGFSSKVLPDIVFYGEHGNKKKIDNGVSDFKESANYASFETMSYRKTLKPKNTNTVDPTLKILNDIAFHETYSVLNQIKRAKSNQKS